MKKSKILNKSVHNSVDTSADVSIGFAKKEEVIKHVKVQGSRKRANPINSVLPRLNNALMPKYEAKAEYGQFWCTLLNPFVLNQYQWERGMFCKATEDSIVRDYGLDLSKGCLPLKKNASDGIVPSGITNCFTHKSPQTYSLATVGSSTISSPATAKALSKYSGSEHYSEFYSNLPNDGDTVKHKRESVRCATNNLDVPGGRQGVQVFWLNDKHTRRERQAKALNLAHSIGRDERMGISLQQTGSDPVDDYVYRDLNYPDYTSGQTEVLYNDNPQYDLEHDMMEMTYTNTSNQPVYIEFIEYEPQQGKFKNFGPTAKPRPKKIKLLSRGEAEFRFYNLLTFF